MTKYILTIGDPIKCEGLHRKHTFSVELQFDDIYDKYISSKIRTQFSQHTCILFTIEIELGYNIL